MTNPDLAVTIGDKNVGTIQLAGDRMRFTYAAAWIVDQAAFPISVSMPLSESTYEPDTAHPFFSNLLPEGLVRIAIAQRLKLTESNDYAMLRALGGDCAGALTIAPNDHPRQPEKSEYRPLPLALIEKTPDADSLYAEVVGQGETRLSLGGAQDKLPVFRDAAGALFVPVGSAASNAILKFPSSRFKHLVENEVLMIRLAARLGLPSCPASLIRPGGRKKCALITRYDRVETGGTTIRLHQEDLCQALRVLPAKKSEQDGGPGFASVFSVVQTNSTRAARDALHLLRWAQFNLLVGNADGHAKNLSLLRRADGGVELAPFSDLVCTRVYEPRISRMGAMRIGSTADPGQIASADWRMFAENIGIAGRLVESELRKLAARIDDAFDATAADFIREFGSTPAAGIVRKVIRAQTRRTLELLGPD